MAKVIHEIFIPRSAYRRDFLGFLQQCWKYLPTYISKDDPFECSFSQDNTAKLPKHWTGGKNAAGLLKYIATFIANYLNAIDKLSDDIKEQTKVLQMRPSISIEMIVVFFSDQFTNKRWYTTNKLKRKSLPKPHNVKVKAEIYGNNGETSNTVLLLSLSLLFYLYFILFSSQIILANIRFEWCLNRTYLNKRT